MPSIQDCKDRAVILSARLEFSLAICVIDLHGAKLNFYPMQQHKYVVLDGMRGIAALSIAALHAMQIANGIDGLRSTYLAVDFFFCLSGFVVAHAYDERLTSKAWSLARFAKVRLARLYPMILFGVGLGGVLLLGSPTFSKVEAAYLIACGLLLLPGGFAIGAQAYQVNNPLWSLCFELLANFYCAVLPSVRVMACSAALAALGLIIGVYIHGNMSGFGFASPEMFFFGIPRVAYPFCAGILIYKLGIEWPATRIHWSVPVLMLVVILFAPPGNIGLLELCMIFLGIPLLVIFGKSASAGLLVVPLEFLGELSYPFYVVHQPVLRGFHHLPLGVLEIPAALLASGVIAWAAYAFFDRPVRRRLSRAVTARHSALA